MKIKLLLCLVLTAVVWLNSSAQTITKVTQTPVSNSTCPNQSITYTVSRPDGASACTIAWTATNGTVLNQNGTTANVQWNDTPGAMGTVTATFSNCGSNNANNGKSASKTELILSVNNQSWGSIGSLPNVDYCTKNQVNIIVPRMFVNGTGGIAQPPLVEVAYLWTIPGGWKEVGSNRTGTFGTSVNTISIVPTNCSLPGSVTVKGVLNDASICPMAGSSATATIQINGANPVLTVGPTAGWLGVTSCDRTPVTFYATTNVALGCVASYNWTFPTSWSLVSQSGNSITLKPSGSAQDSGPIRATVNFTCGSSVTSGNYTPAFIAPGLSLNGSSAVCSGAGTTVSLTNVNSSANATWSVEPTWAFVSTTGTGLSTNIKVIDAYQAGNGSITYSYTIDACSASFTKSFWFGPPDQPGLMTGPTAPNIGHTVRYLVTTPAPGATSYQWVLPRNGKFDTYKWNINRLNAPMDAFVDVGTTAGNVQLVAKNSCGNGGARIMYVTPQGAGGCNPCPIVPSPNPASSEIRVTVNEELAGQLFNSSTQTAEQLRKTPESKFPIEIEYLLHSQKGDLVLYKKTSEKNPELNLAGIENGLYILTIIYGNLGTDQQRIVVLK